jgi:hypothetical protein
VARDKFAAKALEAEKEALEVHVYKEGDPVTIIKLGSHEGESALVSRNNTWIHGRITVKMVSDGAIKSYYHNELKPVISTANTQTHTKHDH